METRRPRVLATICARGGSKGVPGKNLRSLLGKPLIAYAIECARACPTVDRIVVSTDSDKIAAVAESCGAPVPFRRPSELASDTSPKIAAIRHAVTYLAEKEGYEADIIVDLDVGVPLRRPEDITACVVTLEGNPDLDAVVTVYDAERNPYFNMVEIRDGRARLVKDAPAPITRRQDAPKVYSVSPSVFAWRRGSLSVTHLYEGRWGACPVPRERAVDIDDEMDLLFVESLLRQGQKGGSQ
jgi:N-acylneuraminate cytidylyltransferase/CMP-N,N'-diacetyllegionaminic acid synthase